MPAVVIRGIGPTLKGKVGQISNLSFGADNVADLATVVVTGFGSDGTLYVWSGQVKDPPDIKKPGKAKIKVECISGKALTKSKFRVMSSASDIIDVTITVTNDGESPESSSEVVEVVV
jgi:hypothetical protein